jgi:hypothetical protein
LHIRNRAIPIWWGSISRKTAHAGSPRPARAENPRESTGSHGSAAAGGTGTAFALRHVFVRSGGVIVVRVKRPISDALISIGALTMLLVVLVSVDERVRQQVSLRFSSDTAQSQLRDAGVQVHDLVTVIASAARYQSIEHAPMMMFVLAGTVLFVFMIRT